MKYALWKAPTNGLPEANCPVPFIAVQVLPGFGQWILVHLRGDPKEVPHGMIGEERLRKMLDGAAP